MSQLVGEPVETKRYELRRYIDLVGTVTDEDIAAGKFEGMKPGDTYPIKQPVRSTIVKVKFVD